MNPLEKFFYTAKFKISKLPLFVKILPLIVIAIAVAFNIVSKTGVLDTIGMTEEQKTEYILQKEKEAEEQAKLAEEQALIERETTNGFKLFNSPNLTDEEKLAVDFIHACNDKDYARLSEIVDVPNLFNDDNFNGWATLIEIAPYLGKEDNLIGVTATDKDILDDYSHENVVGTERVIQIFTEETQDNRYEFVVGKDTQKMWISPRAGILENTVYSFESKNVFCNGNDLSSYCTKSTTAPISSGKEAQAERDTLWYEFTFKRMADLDSIDFEIKTDLDTYSTIPATMSGKEETAHVMIAEFTPEQIENVSKSIQDSLWEAILSIQSEKSDEEIANYVAVSEVIKSLSSTDEKKMEEVRGSIASIKGVEVYMNTSVSGDVPSVYNYHVAGDATISARVNVRFLLESGECRRTTTMLIRKYDTQWTVVAMSDNILEKINVLDPEW